MTEEEAIAYVTRNAQTEAFPIIADETVEEIVQRNVRAVVWTAETAYAVGAKVQPTVPNGHFYECIEAGTSAEEEPTWTTRQGSFFWETDSDLAWEECALDFDGNLYNTRNAIHECWTLKASMAANQFDISIDQQKWTRSQVYEHCLEMAKAYAPFD